MEITSFILGVCAVIVLMMVLGTLVNYVTTKSLKEEINSLRKDLEYIQMDMEKKVDQLYDFGNEMNRDRVSDQDTLYRHIDSRVDKMVDNISREIDQINQELDKLKTEKSVING